MMKKGFTLIEIIISLAILTIVLAGAFNLFSFGTGLFKDSSDRYDLQSSIRTAADCITRETRYASQIEIVSSSSVPSNIAGLEDNEYYIYLHYNSADNSYYIMQMGKYLHKEIKIGTGSGCSLVFSSQDNNETLYFKINGEDSGKSFQLESKASGLNLQLAGNTIVDASGTGGDAIHYFKMPDSDASPTPSAAPSPSEPAATSPSPTPSPAIMQGVVKVYAVTDGAGGQSSNLCLAYNLPFGMTIKTASITSGDSSHCSSTTFNVVPGTGTVQLNVTNPANNFDLKFQVVFNETNTPYNYEVTYKNNDGWQIQ